MSAAPPDEAALREAALTHLARYATSRAGLLRMLDRRVARWARANAAEAEAVRAAKDAARNVVAALAAAGAVDDAAFATARAHSLKRAGRSRRAIAAHLAARGVVGETAASVLPDDPEGELAAALALARRRRIGPFRRGPVDPTTRQRELGMLARAGFGRGVATRALDTPEEAAEALITALRQL